MIKHLECIYIDSENPSRNSSRDRVREIDCHLLGSLDEAREAVFAILTKYGGMAKCPKILKNIRGVMWIECEIPFQTFRSNGTVDIKCLAFEIEFKDSENTIDLDADMKSFATALGPNFYL